MVVTSLAAIPVPARAQLLTQYYPSGIPGYESWFSDAVLERPRSEYDAPGVRAGNFIIRPSLSEGFGYNSNIFGGHQAVGSALSDTKGNVGIDSDWSRDSVSATVGFDRLQYLQHPAGSTTDWSAGLSGGLDIGENRATLSYAHVTSTSEAAQLGTLTAGQPITTAFDSVHAGYEANFGNFGLAPALQASSYRFANGSVGHVSEASNDYNTLNGSLTGSYQLAPGRSIVIVASGTSAAYPNKVAGVATPDYTDVSLAGGLDYRSGDLFRYRALFGFERRSYVNASLTGTSAPLVEFDVIWTPTRLTTVTGQVSRNLQNAVGPGGSQSFTYTNVRMVVDHEYLRNVLLQTYGQFQNADLQTHGETQHVISAGASVTWLFNRNLSVVSSFSYSQSSDNVFSSFDQTGSLAELTLNFHL
jgi:hypothetical protein